MFSGKWGADVVERKCPLQKGLCIASTSESAGAHGCIWHSMNDYEVSRRRESRYGKRGGGTGRWWRIMLRTILTDGAGRPAGISDGFNITGRGDYIMARNYDVVIIGAGPRIYVAFKAAQFGFLWRS